MLTVCAQCVTSSMRTYHIRPESEHQRQREAQRVQGADDRRTPRLMHLATTWDPTDGELENRAPDYY